MGIVLFCSTLLKPYRMHDEHIYVVSHELNYSGFSEPYSQSALSTLTLYLVGVPGQTNSILKTKILTNTKILFSSQSFSAIQLQLSHYGYCSWPSAGCCSCPLFTSLVRRLLIILSVVGRQIVSTDAGCFRRKQSLGKIGRAHV